MLMRRDYIVVTGILFRSDGEATKSEVPTVPATCITHIIVATEVTRC